MQKDIAINKINIDGADVNSVNARELHKELELKSDFSTWIKKELSMFTENVDYVLLHIKVEQVSGAKHLIDYIVTLDVAKHLSMLQRNKKGMYYRQLFIDIEKQFNKPMTVEQLLKENAKMIGQLENKVITLQTKIKDDEPITNFGKAISQSVATVKIGDWIKSIKEDGDIDIGRNKAFRWFRDEKYIQKDNVPYQRYIDQGLFEVKENLIVTDTKQFITFTTLLTGKGQMYFAKLLKELIRKSK